MSKIFFKKWVIPPGWCQLIHKFRRNSSQIVSKSSKDIISFKNIHIGKRCFILATGPSINQMDLTVLKSEFCIAVSLFGYHKDIDVIRPRYHVAAPTHSPLKEEQTIQYLDMFRKYYTWPVDIFLGIRKYQYSFDNVLEKYPEFLSNHFHFIDYNNSLLLSDENRDMEDVWDPLKQPYNMMTVVAEALMMAFYMGFSEVYLLGCDFNYLKDLEGKKNQHFYSDQKALEGRENLMAIPNPLESFFSSSANVWRQYRLIREHFEQYGRKIYNASPDSMLDMFPKVVFANIFKDI